MSPTTYRSARSLLLAALAFAGVHATPALALNTSTVATKLASDANTVLDRASELVTDAKLIRAQAMLIALQDSPAGAALSDEQGQRLWSLLANIERKLQKTDRIEISLQKAQLALSNDNLVQAQRQASAVMASNKSESTQIELARAIKELIALRQTDAATKVADAIQRASTAFEAGDYAGAKLLIIRIGQLGLELPENLQLTLDTYRDRIAQLEQSRGASFGSFNPVLGMLAPESGMSTDWLMNKAERKSTQDGARSGSYMGQPENQPAPIEIDLDDDQPVDHSEHHMDDMDESMEEAMDEAAQEPVVELVEEQPEIDLLDAARRFEAQSLLGQGNIAFEERQFNRALEIYTQIITSYSDYVSAEEFQLAKDRRSDAQVQLGTQGGPDGDILVDTTEATSIARQRAEAAFMNYLQQASQALAEGDTNTARNLAAQGDLTIKRARDVMPESTYEQYLDSVASLITEINTIENAQRIAQAEAEKQRLAAETAALAAERNQERNAKIIANLERVMALQQELKYEEALEVVESILFLDPTNPSGLLLKDIISDILIYRENLQLQRTKSLSYANQSIDNQEAMIAPKSIIGYPDDWPAISFRRGDTLEFAESEANRSVLATMRDTRMPVEFNGNAFEDVVAFIGSTTNIDIDVDWESLADIGVDPDTPVDLKLKSVQVSVLLDRVLGKVSDPTLPAGWAIQDGILTIASDEVLRLNTVLETYDIRDLIFVVPDFQNAPNFNLQSAVAAAAGGGGGGGGGGRSPFTGGTQRFQTEPREDRVQAIVDLIQANVDPDGWVAIGGDTNSITELNGNFIITSTPKNHRAIIGLLNKLRQQRAVQINVETRFLSVDQNFFEQIGFDLDVYFNANNSEYQLARVLDPSLLPSDYFKDGAGLNNAGNIFEDNVSGDGLLFDTDGDGIPDTPTTQPVFGPGFNGGTLPDGSSLGEDSFSIIRAAQNSFGLTNTLAAGSQFATTILGLNPALGVSGRFLDDIQVDFLVQATQADQRSVNLNAPRLTFTNGQRAFIAVSTSQTFVSDLTPVVGSAAGAFDPVISTISTGVVIDITGVASADRRYVTMTILTTQSSLTFSPDPIVVQGAAGGGGVAGGTSTPFQGTIQVPIIKAAQINTTVTIPDQGTVLLGGQRIVDELEVETGVPVLSKIPILSRFFSNRIDTKTEKTLLILLKPTILIQNEEEELNFPGLLDQLGR